QDSEGAGEVDVPLVERRREFTVAVADLALLFPQLRRVADVLDVRVDGLRRVLPVDLIDERERVAVPVPVAHVERQSEPRAVDSLQDSVDPFRIVADPAVVLDPGPDGAVAW